MLGAIGDLDPVAGLRDEMRDIDHRQRIGAVDFQPVSRLYRFQRFARFQRRQRAFQSSQVEFCDDHVGEM